MKDLINKFLENLHVLIFLYSMYGTWVIYDEHMVQLQDTQAQFPQIEADIQNTKKKIDEIQEFLKKTDEYKTRVENVAKNIEEVQKQLPADINDAQILDFITGELKVLNVKDPSLTPGPEEASAYYISKPYTVKAKGTFLQFLIFLERIGNATRIYNVKSLKITRVEESKKGRFQVVQGEGIIQAFRYNPDFKVDRGFDKIQGIQ